MKLRQSCFILSLGFSLLTSCVKDELTKPAEITFTFSMNKDKDAAKFMQFDQGEVSFGTIEFDGNREAGQDIFFVSDFPTVVSVDLDQEVASEDVIFDVPQGIYNRIDLRLGLNELEAGPSIWYEGVYESLKDGDLRVIIELESDIPIEIRAQGPSANNQVVINKDIPISAKLHFDPIELFQFANSRQLESADITEIDGEPVIVISGENNVVIFNQIISRLERSVTVTFE